MPRYGDDDAVLRDFAQKQQPHRVLAELIGNDKEVSMHKFISMHHTNKVASQTMECFPIWGTLWLSEPPGPLPAENKRKYISRKDRKREKKEMEAKEAVLKKMRERKKVSCILVALGIPLTRPGRRHNSVLVHHPVTTLPSSN